MFENKNEFKKNYKQRFMSLLSKSINEATNIDRYVALASMARDEMSVKWVSTNNYYLKNAERQVYYFSLEFLVGKFLELNLQYLGVENVCREGLKELDISLDDIIACEPDAGLGNGGLGRLAACFLDSLAAQGYPGHGCGIRYKYGLFKQQIVDGYQVELPDNWLRLSNPWEVRKPDKAIVVRFYGYVQTHFDEAGNAKFVHKDYTPVLAVPYDMPILGAGNGTVNTLRLWSAESVDEPFDFASFSRGDHVNAVSKKYAVEAISEVLYPDDSNYSNRVLRLKQQYFFVSAGVQSIIRHFKLNHKDLFLLPDLIAIHINDTHPALVVPELMRILIDDEGYGWDEAWNMTTRIVAYTNHTIMPEALEKWPVDVFRELMPRIYMIVEEINRRFCRELTEHYPGDNWRVRDMAIIADDVVKMAHLAVVGSFSVNGVAAVHTELLKHEVMKDFYDYYPAKFNNKTNGITHRRWLIKANPGLAALITEAIGANWQKDPTELKFLQKMRGDTALYEKMARIKRENKERLVRYIEEANHVRVDPDSIFDAQVKRIHAYKRQLLNALHIHYLYNRIIEQPEWDMAPRTFIFAGKAAPSYYFAKTVVKYINELANLVNNDRAARRKMRVVFLENYNVGLAEMIFPASDVSEQISTASKEASGTGNMKFMMNGAVTLGTNDGANIEIRQLVGDDNFILFGLNVDEVLKLQQGGYNAGEIYRDDHRIHQVINQLMYGDVFPNVPPETFTSLSRALLDYNDEFFVLKDFAGYAAAHQRIDSLYRRNTVWYGMALENIAMSGYFSSDNTIRQYANEIWKIRSCIPKKL
jgi:starch phosphorylase